jgi:histidyl-tRNA synthetase
LAATVKAIKGTRDILPPEIHKWHFVEDKARAICATYGYEEIRTPIFEATELFARGIGEVTDIVTKQMFNFPIGREQQVTLRPENTAPAVRAYVEHGFDNESSITKWYYIGPMFRYEQPQKGRYRQFSQFGIEVLGTENPAVDVEVIELLVGFLKSCGLSNFETQLNTVGCKEDRVRYSAALQQILRPKKSSMCEDCQDRIERNPLRVLDCKVEADQPIINALPAIDEYLCESCRRHFEAVQKYLKLASIDTVRNKRLVRGLDYYTKTTFEIVAGGLGAQNSVAGGGRYDGLVEELGGKPTKAIGFALGLDRLILALPDSIGEMAGIRVFIVALDDAAFDYAFEKLQAPLRNAGIPSEVDYQRRSLKGAMRQADKKKVDWVIIAGEQERLENKATLKNMKTGEQGTYSINEVIEKVR